MTPVALLTRLICALATLAPDVSCTAPWMLAVNCAKAGTPQKANIEQTRVATTDTLRCTIGFSCIQSIKGWLLDCSFGCCGKTFPRIKYAFYLDRGCTVNGF